MAKRLKTYRLEPSECADFAWAVAETGETESDVLRRAIRVYIQSVKAGGEPSVVPVAEVLVYTAVEDPPWDLEADEELPEDPPCRHPAEAVEAGECGICHADVW